MSEWTIWTHKTQNALFAYDDPKKAPISEEHLTKFIEYSAYLTACEQRDLAMMGAKDAHKAINELKDILRMVLNEWSAPDVYEKQITDALGITRPD